ncbi:TonB-dependent receptor [Gluconacetobacter sp. Hr-1-5]|uniref:TonB-dependent receptor n=1 Tax=Gluconacetobacter sp. Hr-1-5 TaxID=3395370 RepID=UPI003B527E4C
MLNKTLPILLGTTSLICVQFAFAAQPDKLSRHASPDTVADNRSSDGTLTSANSASSNADRETITVQGHGADATGVTGRASGGGLISHHTSSNTMMTVTRDFIAKQGLGTNPIGLVAMEPGVNVAPNDPFGVQGSSITVRGLTTDEIGMLLDGMPTNDVGNMNSYAPQYVASEDLQSINIQPSGGDITAPVFGSAGGLMSLTLRDPSHKRGGLADFTYGSFGTDREFMRVESGDVGSTGLRAYLSYYHIAGGQLAGAGRIVQHHVDFKVSKDWGKRSYSSLTVTASYFITPYLINPTLANWNLHGISSGAYSEKWYPNNSNYWKLHSTAFYPIFLSQRNHFALTDKMTADINPYFEYALGGNQGGLLLPGDGAVYIGNQPATANLSGLSIQDGKALVSSTASQITTRTGFSSKLAYKTGVNNFYVGNFFEFSNENTTYGVTPVTSSGNPAVQFGNHSLIYATYGNGVTAPIASQNATSYTTADGLSFGDQISLMNDRLKIDAGLKLLWFIRDVTNRQPGAQYKSSFSEMKPMPYLGAVYQINANSSIYANASTNYRAPSNTSFIDTFSPLTGKITSAASSNPRSEYIISEEIGYRYHSSLGEASISAFNYNMTNHILSSQIYINNSLVTEVVNVGGQTSRGIDIQAGLRPWHHLRPYASWEYLHATDDSNYFNGLDYLRTAGKTAVRSPKYTASFGLDYDDGHFFANVDIRYVASQYSTLMNDEALPKYVTANAGIGYRFRNYSFLESPIIKFNIVNMANNKYLGAVTSVTSNARTQVGINGHTIAGQSPTYSIAAPLAVMGSISTGF